MSTVEEVLNVVSPVVVTTVEDSTISIPIEVDEIADLENSGNANGDAMDNSEVAAITSAMRTVQTQHGDYRTVDEENIVLLKITRSPVPTEEVEFIWIPDPSLENEV